MGVSRQGERARQETAKHSRVIDSRSGKPIFGLHDGHDLIQLAVVADVERMDEAPHGVPLLLRMLLDARPLDERRRVARQARGQHRQTGPGCGRHLFWRECGPARLSLLGCPMRIVVGALGQRRHRQPHGHGGWAADGIGRRFLLQKSSEAATRLSRPRLRLVGTSLDC